MLYFSMFHVEVVIYEKRSFIKVFNIKIKSWLCKWQSAIYQVNIWSTRNQQCFHCEENNMTMLVLVTW